MINQQNTEVKIIRLNTGEDVVGNCLFDDNNSSLLIESPMKVMVTRITGSGKAMLVMMPWLPLEIIQDNLVTISYNDIITTVNPKNSFVDYYFDTIQRYEELLESKEQNALDFDDEFGDEMEDDDSDIDEDMIQEMMEAIQNTKKGTIH